MPKKECEYRKGDSVFDIGFGWGTVESVNFGLKQPVLVDFGTIKLRYKACGSSSQDVLKVLAFFEYGNSPDLFKRPKWLPKAGEMIAVKMQESQRWLLREFIKKSENGCYQVVGASVYYPIGEPLSYFNSDSECIK